MAIRDQEDDVGGRRRLIVLVAVAVVLLLALVPAALFIHHFQQQASPTVQAPHGAQQIHSAVAPGPVLWGMWIKEADGKQYPQPIIAAREATLGHRLDVFHWYENWDSDWSNVAGMVDLISGTGRIPMITWEAFDRPPERVAKGDYDAYIDTWARGAASKKPAEIWIRVFHEFNDPSSDGGYPWSIDDNSPARLIAAWRHIHDRFAAAGADNVKWIWNPDGVHIEDAPAGYPGDHYDDYTGWDTYGYDNANDYSVVSGVSKKPMVIGEFGPGDGLDSGLQRFTQEVAGGAYPLLHAVVYFDEGKYAVGSSSSARDALRQMLASKAFASPAPSATP